MSGPSRRSDWGLTTDRAAGPDWAARSLCRQLAAQGEVDLDLWFPPSEGADQPWVKKAKRICRSCPVRPECLAYALQRGEEYGIWGALTSRERRKTATRTGAA